MNLVKEQEKAKNKIIHFTQKWGREHLDLACHAAFPLAITPELLYCLRENFLPQCPWIAVADLILSSLCDPVGDELYEMDGVLRDLLLKRLATDIRFEQDRLNQLADFMGAYIEAQLPTNPRADSDLGKTPEWVALAYIHGEDAQQLRQKLEELLRSGNVKIWQRLANFIEDEEDLLIAAGLEPLMVEVSRQWGSVLNSELETFESFEFEAEVATIVFLDREDLQTNILIENQVIKVSGETCPSGFTFVTYQEALENRDLLGQKLDSWDIARLADGASMDGRGYGLKIREKDERILGHSLCKKILQQKEILQQWKFQVPTVNSRGEIIKNTTYTTSYFTEILTDRVDLEMVAIPGGTFTMGSPKNERGSTDDERPQHNVTISPFFMGKYPVTQAQWRAIASRDDLKVEIDLDPDPSRFKGDNRPVETVNWYEAVEFCKRLSKLTGRDYRLPSEAEWEYACRGVTKPLDLEKGESYPPFHFGETITSDLANYDASRTYVDEPKGEESKETSTVGQFSPNAFGLYDMHGNVWEWCADDWHDNYNGAPTDGSAWLDSNDGENINNENESYSSKNQEKESYSVLRGGSWLNHPGLCRSASRDDSLRRDIRNLNSGFRVVCGFGRTL